MAAQTSRHRWSISRGYDEGDTASYRAPKIDGLYVKRSIERLEILADRPVRSAPAARQALAEYGHVLLDREREVLEVFFQCGNSVSCETTTGG